MIDATTAAQRSGLGPAREYGPFVAAVLLLGLCIPRHAGFMVLFAAPLAAVWAVYSVRVALRSPARRRVLASKAVVLAISFSVIALVHCSYARTARAQAEDVEGAVSHFQAREARFPEIAAEAGLDESRLWREGKVIYKLQDGKPRLIYLATFEPFSTYSFDFDTRTWVFEAG